MFTPVLHLFLTSAIYPTFSYTCSSHPLTFHILCYIHALLWCIPFTGHSPTPSVNSFSHTLSHIYILSYALSFILFHSHTLSHIIFSLSHIITHSYILLFTQLSCTLRYSLLLSYTFSLSHIYSHSTYYSLISLVLNKCFVRTVAMERKETVKVTHLHVVFHQGLYYILVLKHT